MQYNVLGNTDLKVSHVSLGGAAFSNIYGSFEEDRFVELIRETLKYGVNYLETGPWYGQGSSEKTVGKRYHHNCVKGPVRLLVHQNRTPEAWLRHANAIIPSNDENKALAGVPRESYYIASKVGRYEKITEKMFDFSKEKTEFGVDNTLRLLGLDYVDIIQIHDSTFAPDQSVILKETLPALERAVRDGKARYIGLADYDIDLMKEIIEESDVKISSILSYSKSTFIDNRLQNYTKYFKDRGVGVINAAATGMGLLSNNGPQPWHPASDDIKALCKRASEYCKEQNVELARLATWFTLNQPGIDTNICGFYNLHQLRDTMQMMETGLTDHEQKVLAEVQARFFDNVSLHWDGVELIEYKAKLNNITT